MPRGGSASEPAYFGLDSIDQQRVSIEVEEDKGEEIVEKRRVAAAVAGQWFRLFDDHSVHRLVKDAMHELRSLNPGEFYLI